MQKKELLKLFGIECLSLISQGIEINVNHLNELVGSKMLVQYIISNYGELLSYFDNQCKTEYIDIVNEYFVDFIQFIDINTLDRKYGIVKGEHGLLALVSFVLEF